MEAPQFFRGGFCRTGNTQPAQHEVKDNKAGGEHFIIEDLLDFPNEDETTVFADNAFDSAAGNSTDSSTVTVVDSCNSSFSGCEPRIPGDVSGDLCVPYDDLAELEWLSNFVEESFSSEDLQKLQLISGVRVPKEEVSETRDLSGNDGRNSPIFRPEVSVPGKARSKRSRAAAPCNWTSRLHVLSPTTSSSESDGFAANSGKKTGKSAPKKKESAESVICDGRKCLHCATDKTPQWRTGPMGPKTLCNACGVRYKSGRLVPEYRPAASPTFVLTKHSNSHRKVLELRRQKEMHRAQPQPQFLHANPMFDAMATLAAEDDYFIQHPGSDFRQLI